MPISKIKEKIDFYETLFTERYLPLPLQIILNNCSDNEKSAFFMAMMPIFFDLCQPRKNTFLLRPLYSQQAFRTCGSMLRFWRQRSGQARF